MEKHGVVGVGIFLMLLLVAVVPAVTRIQPLAAGWRVVALAVFAVISILLAAAILRHGGGGAGEALGCLAGLVMWGAAVSAGRLAAALGGDSRSRAWVGVLGAAGGVLLLVVLALLVVGRKTQGSASAAPRADTSRSAAVPAAAAASSGAGRGWRLRGYSENDYRDHDRWRDDPEAPAIVSNEASIVAASLSVAQEVLDQARRSPAERDSERLLRAGGQLRAVLSRFPDPHAAGVAWGELIEYLAGLADHLAKKPDLPP